MAFLELDRIGKRFGSTRVLEDVTAGVVEGETLVLLGPSGSGKTTLLRIIAGFETPENGSVRVGDEDVTNLAPAKRNFGMVFQHYALFPHQTVAENVAFGLAAQGVDRAKIATRVEELLDLVELGELGARAIHEISGGQQQRVALARALAPGPRLLLLDEPLSNLDPTLRERTRRQLRELLGRVGMTAVWVTHEQQEAFDVGDRIALLDGGHLQQLGTAEDLYQRPATPFVADFVGQASWLPGVGEADGSVSVAAGVRWRATAADELGEGPVEVLLRPEDCRLKEPGEGRLPARVTARRFAGFATYVELVTDDGRTLTVAAEDGAPEVGARTGVEPIPGRPSPRSFAAAMTEPRRCSGADAGSPSRSPHS